MHGRKVFKNYDCEKEPLHRWFGALKVAGAAIGAVIIDNPWATAALVGVGVQGAIEQGMVLSDKVQPIGNSGDNAEVLRNKLKELAESHRDNGGHMEKMSGPGESAIAGNYDVNSAIAGTWQQGDYPSTGVGAYNW